MSEHLSPEGHPLWRASAIDLVPSRTGNKVSVEVSAVDGPVLAIEDGGTVTDPSGVVLLHAPLIERNRRTKGVEVTDAGGRALGSALVRNHGPRKATYRLTDPAGEEVAALESRDRKGRELAFVTARGADAGVMRLTDEESGLLARLKTHRTRTYRVELTGPVDEALRGLMLATAIRYEAVLAAIRGEQSMD